MGHTEYHHIGVPWHNRWSLMVGHTFWILKVLASQTRQAEKSSLKPDDERKHHVIERKKGQPDSPNRMMGAWGTV